MIIRQFNIQDQEQVVALWKSCGLTVPWNDPYKDIQRKLKVNPELFLVGEINGTVMATIMGGYEGHRGWINYLAVSKNHRREGYARLLMDTIESALRQKECPKINLQVRESNTGIIEFYKALGYVQDKAVSLGKRIESDLPESD